MKTRLKLSGALALGLALLSMLIIALACGPTEEAVPRSYSCNVYTEQGCAKFVVASGGEIEIQSGGTLDLQAGATTDIDGDIASSAGAITMTDDVYITDTLDVDGAVTFNSTLDVDGNISSGTGAITITDGVGITDTLDVDGAVTFNSTLDVDGNISSGTGAITITDGVGITDTLDVDGAVTFNSTLDVDGNISSGTGAITITDDVNITGTLTLESVAFSGPVRFGSASSVVSGTTVAHGLATTPTVALLTPGSTGGYTATIYVLATDATSVTVGVQDGVTVPTVYWLAGK